MSSSMTSPSAAKVGEPAAAVVATASSGRGCWRVGPALCRRRRSWTCCSRAWMRLARASVGRAEGWWRWWWWSRAGSRGVRGGGAYESRLAELSRRRAGRKTHCLPRRAQRSQMSLRWVRSHRILREKQFWQVRETRPVAALPADVSRAGGARDMACSTGRRKGSRRCTQDHAAAAAAAAAGSRRELGSLGGGSLRA